MGGGSLSSGSAGNEEARSFVAPPNSCTASSGWMMCSSYFNWEFFALNNLFAEAFHAVPRHLTRPRHTRVPLSPLLPPGPELVPAQGWLCASCPRSRL